MPEQKVTFLREESGTIVSYCKISLLSEIVCVLAAIMRFSLSELILNTSFTKFQIFV